MVRYGRARIDSGALNGYRLNLTSPPNLDLSVLARCGRGRIDCGALNGYRSNLTSTPYLLLLSHLYGALEFDLYRLYSDRRVGVGKGGLFRLCKRALVGAGPAMSGEACLRSLSLSESAIRFNGQKRLP